MTNRNAVLFYVLFYVNIHVTRDERIVTIRLLSNRILKVISNHEYRPRQVIVTM